MVALPGDIQSSSGPRGALSQRTFGLNFNFFRARIHFCGALSRGQPYEAINMAQAFLDTILVCLALRRCARASLSARRCCW